MSDDYSELSPEAIRWQARIWEMPHAELLQLAEEKHAEQAESEIDIEIEVMAHNEVMRRLNATDQLLRHCDDCECSECAKIICPHGEELHFHHDGCPACCTWETRLLSRNAGKARSVPEATKSDNATRVSSPTHFHPPSLET